MVCCQKLHKTSEKAQEPSNLQEQELMKRQEQLHSSQSQMCQELKERKLELNCKWPLKIQELILSGRRQERPRSGMIRVDRSQQRTNWPVDRTDQQRPQLTKRLKISVK